MEDVVTGFAGIVPRRAGGIVVVTTAPPGRAQPGWPEGTWSSGSWVTVGDGAGEPAFQVGSVTKVITALLLADLVAGGEVRLDEPVGEVLGVPLTVGGRPTTYLDLATHRSGLPRVAPLRVLRGLDRSDPYRTLDEGRVLEVAAACADGVRPRRAARIRYSNLGFALLGLALARRLGTSWERAVTDRVLLPSGLGGTGTAPRRRALGTGADGVPSPTWDLAGFAPAGGLWTTVADLTALLGLVGEALTGGTAAETPREAVLRAVRCTAQPRARSVSAHLGLAWHLTERGAVVWHNGGVLGAGAFVGVDRRDGRGVGVLTVGGVTSRADRAALDLLLRRRGTPAETPVRSRWRRR